MHLIPSGKSRTSVKIVKRSAPASSSIVECARTRGPHDTNAENAATKDGGRDERKRPNFAKVYPAWQGYRIDFKLQKIYRPVETRRLGFPPEQPDEVRQTRRAIWEKLVPNSSSLALDLLEGLRIDTQTLDEVRDILSAKWNRTTNNFENRWEWFRRRLCDLGFEETQIRLLLGGEPVGDPVRRDGAKNQHPDNQAGSTVSALPVPRRRQDNGIGVEETEPPAHKWSEPSARAHLGRSTDERKAVGEISMPLPVRHCCGQDGRAPKKNRDRCAELSLHYRARRFYSWLRCTYAGRLRSSLAPPRLLRTAPLAAL